MVRRIRPMAIAVALWLACASHTAEARYRYGQYATGSGEGGVFAYLEGLLSNPRNADAVVATEEAFEDFGGGENTLTPIVPQWSDELAGRLGVGYGWAGGSKVVFTVWGFQTDQSSSGDGPPGGFTHFAVGPPIRTGGGFVGDQGSPGSWRMTTEIEAGTADLAYGHEHALAEEFVLEWSAGVRYARYEEVMNGSYDEAASTDGAFGANSYRAAKSNEGEMFGVRGGLRGSYRFAESFSLDAGLGLSFLDGELRASSSLVPDGSANAATTASSLSEITDDSRSGSVRDLDLAVTWRLTGDAVRVWLGWEQQVWEGITTDSVRNFPGTSAPLRDRDSVTISGYKLGVFVRF